MEDYQAGMAYPYKSRTVSEYEEYFEVDEEDLERQLEESRKHWHVNSKWKRIVYTIPVDATPDLTNETHFKIKAFLRPAIAKTPTATRRFDNKTHRVDYGCLFAATYFYTLVSNTPIDESYIEEEGDKPYQKGEKFNYWERARISVNKRKNRTINDEMKTVAEIAAELEERGTKIKKTYHRKRIHYPDKEYVRGDWVMTFRGKTFKAFRSVPNKKSKKVSVDYYFHEEDFLNPITNQDALNLSNKDIYSDKFEEFKDADGNIKKRPLIKNSVFKDYIWNIAEQIASQVPTGSDFSDDIMPYITNINPRWVILEYGKYQSDPNGPYKGLDNYKLPHGVTDSGFSFMAPMGFERVVRAQYNAILERSSRNSESGVGTASAYTRGNRLLKWNFDITKMDKAEYEQLRKALIEQDETLQFNDIHKMNVKNTWTIKEVN